MPIPRIAELVEGKTGTPPPPRATYDAPGSIPKLDQFLADPPAVRRFIAPKPTETPIADVTTPQGFLANMGAGIEEGWPQLLRSLRSFSAMKARQDPNLPKRDGPVAPSVEGIKDVGDFTSWLGHIIGANAPNLAASFAGGLAGAAAGSAILPGPGTIGGGILGAFAPSYVLNAAEIFENLIEEGIDPNTAAKYAEVGGFASGVLDSIGPGRLGGRAATAPVKSFFVKQALKSVGKEIALAPLTEGLPETAQEAISIAIEKHAAGKPFELDENDWSRMVNAFAAGTALGATAGAAVDVTRTARGAIRGEPQARQPVNPPIEVPAEVAADTRAAHGLQVELPPSAAVQPPPTEPTQLEALAAATGQQELAPPVKPKEARVQKLAEVERIEQEIAAIPQDEEIPPELVERAVQAEEEVAQAYEAETSEEVQPDAEADPYAPPVPRTEREGTAISRPRPPIGPTQTGSDTQVLVPGQNIKFSATYAVRELSDVYPSHIGSTFQPTPGYESVNERNYEDPANRETVILNSSRELFNPAFLITDNPDATNGPPVIDQNGNVLGGNSRTMTLQRVYASHPQGAAAYKQLLKLKASQYGIDPESIDQFRQPIFLRQLSADSLLRNPKLQQDVIRATNVSAVGELTAAERARADAGQLSPESAEYLGGLLEQSGEDATIAQVLDKVAGVEVVERLVKDGVFSVQEKRKLIDSKNKVVTAAAKERISQLLVGRFFRDSDQFQRTPPSIRNKLERIAAPLLKIDNQPGWDLIPEFREAVDLLEAARSRGIKNLGDLVAQQSMFPGAEPEGYTPRVVKLAEALQSLNPNKLVKKIREYVSDRTPTMFREAGPAEAFRDSFENLMSDTRGSATIRAATLGLIEPNPDPVRKSREPGILKRVGQAIRPTIEVVRSEGTAGQELARMIEDAEDTGELAAGQRLYALAESGLPSVSKDEALTIQKIMQGRARGTPELRAISSQVKAITDNLADRAQDVGIKVRRGTGERVPFVPRRNYFPHVVRLQELARGRGAQFGSVMRSKPWKLVQDVSLNLQEMNVAKDHAQAIRQIDSYLDFVETGKIPAWLAQYLVETKQATRGSDALAKLRRHRSEIREARHGSLEFAREIDLPFWDPDPRRVLPHWIASASTRLENARVFGQDSEFIEEQISRIELAGGDHQAVQAIIKRIVGNFEHVPGGDRLPRLIRTIQGFKLGLAAIPNASQSINTWLYSDLRATLYGFKEFISGRGKALGTRSGATIESVLNEMVREAGGDSRALGIYLKATGFTGTERMNRTVAASAGANYAGRMAKRLLKNPQDIRANRALSELGIDPGSVTGGTLTAAQLLMAAKKMADITQFRARPSDLPYYGSSPWGKVFFQFKTYIYNQTRFVFGRNMIDLLATPGSREWGRAARNLLMLATVFPLTGEAISSLRSLITGRERDEEGLMRYFMDIAQVGAAGILAEVIQSGQYRRGTGFLGGPALSEAGEAIDVIGGSTTIALKPGEERATKVSERLWKAAFRKTPLVGQIAYPRVYSRSRSRKAGRFGALQ